MEKWIVAELPPLPPSELEVLKIVWTIGRAAVRDVVAKIPAERGLDFKTVQTYLRRLEAKGYVRSELVAKTRIYQTRNRRATVVRQLVADFLERLFDGDPLPLMQNLVEHHGLSECDLRELREMLQKKERKDT